MKTNMLWKSGIACLILAGVGITNLSAAVGEESIYNSLQTLHDSLGSSTTIAHNGVGPTDVASGVLPAGWDIYDSVRKFNAAQDWRVAPTARGAQGPIRSESDMAMQRNEKEWRQMVGIFYGSD